jgi:transposase-like protein
MSPEVTAMRQAESGLTPRGRQWLVTIQQWERSGLSMGEFCARRGLKPATLSWWRQEIRRRGGEKRSASDVELVEIGRGVSSVDSGFAIELTNGLRVHVPMRFDAAALKELLGVLGAC